VEIQGGDLDAAVTLTVSTGGFSSATALASELQSQLLSELTPQQPESQISVTVDTAAATSTSGVSLVLQSSAGPITADIDFESSIQGQSGNLQINTVALPDAELDPGETLELTLTVNTATGPQTVTLQQTLDADETLQDAAQGLVADLETQTDGQGPPLGLSGDLVQVTIPGGPEGTEGTPVPSIQSIQITAPQGANLNTVELSVGAEIAAQSSSVQTDEHVATVAIPSDVGDLSQSAQLDVSIAGPGFPVDAQGNPGIDFQFNISPGQTPQNVAEQLLNEIQTRLGGAAQETVDVRIETGEGGELSLVLQSSAGAIEAELNFESSIQGQSGTQQINTVELPAQLDTGETLELTLTVTPPPGGTPPVPRSPPRA
ncbi:MAG: hypothetical protein MK030_06370, partial [SAR116 cluster bacterium]|nr:hypothetical protein [SAR116 cluster bacterium]